MTNAHFADHCSGYFLLLANFRRNPAGTDPTWLRKALQAELNEIETKVSHDGKLKGLFDRARYPMVALADSLALSSDWPGKAGWTLLEMTLYNTRVGGQEFYTQAQQLTASDHEIGEIYFLCLALGFQGALGAGERQDLMRRLGSWVPDRVNDVSDRLTPDTYAHPAQDNLTLLPAWGAMRVAVVLLGALALSLLMYSVIKTETLEELKGLATQVVDLDAGKQSDAGK